MGDLRDEAISRLLLRLRATGGLCRMRPVWVRKAEHCTAAILPPLCHLLEHVMRRLWSSRWSQTLAAGIWHRCSCSECADEARPLSGFFFCRVSFNKSELISHRGRRPCTSPVPDTHRYSLCRLQDPVTGCRVCVHP